MSTVEVKVPNIGDFKEVEVIELLVKPGDTIKVDQSLVTVESDKASMEIPSTHAGVVQELKVKVGDKVNEGSLLLTVQEPAAGRRAGPGAERVELQRPGRRRMRNDGAGRGPGRLLGRLPLGRPRHEHRAGREVFDPGRRLPERGLHPVQGAAARGPPD